MSSANSAVTRAPGVETGNTIAMRNGRPLARNFSSTGCSDSARIGCAGRPCASFGKAACISAHTSFETVVALPFRSMLNALTTSAFVPNPMVAPMGWPASRCAPSSSPVMSRSRITFQFACGSSVTYSPSSSKKPFSYAMASGAMSVSLMKPIFSCSFSSFRLAACAGTPPSSTAASAMKTPRRRPSIPVRFTVNPAAREPKKTAGSSCTRSAHGRRRHCPDGPLLGPCSREVLQRLCHTLRNWLHCEPHQALKTSSARARMWIQAHE